jgi:hypothetical protein
MRGQTSTNVKCRNAVPRLQNVIYVGKVIYACGHASRRPRYARAPQHEAEIVEALQPTAALILRSLDPQGARRLEGWPHTSCMETDVMYARILPRCHLCNLCCGSMMKNSIHQ